MVAPRGVAQVWARLHEPRAVTFMAFVRYVLAGLIGLALLVVPPHLPETAFGLAVGLVDSLALTAGAVVAAVATLRGTWWLERCGLLVVIFAYLAQVSLLWNLFDSGAWRLLLTLSILEACAGLGHRYALISWAYLDPTR